MAAIVTKKTQNLDTYCLIWLDTSPIKLRKNIQAQKQFRKLIDHTITFNNDQKCLEYITSVAKDDRIILIVSGQSYQTIVPEFIKYRQIASIYVYCIDKKDNEQWAKNFIKVKYINSLLMSKKK
jgi:hypothetical protein